MAEGKSLRTRLQSWIATRAAPIFRATVHSYTTLPNSGEVHHLVSEKDGIVECNCDGDVFAPDSNNTRRLLDPVRLLWLNLGFFLISSLMFTLSLSPSPPLYKERGEDTQRNYCLQQVSMPSPILDEVDIRVAPQRMDATLLNRDPPTIYRQEPSIEIDRAWAALYDTRPIALTRSQVLAMGKDPAEAVRIPPSWGRGNDSYFGRIDAFHQMHCLDALRREAYFGHYYGAKYPGGLNTTSEMHRLHLSHCVWLLAQNIMCSANTDVYTHIWTDTLDHAWPDFNIQHQCKSYDTILDWQRRNALDEDDFVALRRPDGYPYRVMTHKFKEIHGWFLDHEDVGDYESGEIA
ncbi:hypothetical protein AtubIFM57258_002470 [Aspergillus tubingensis]|nr:hypothetical protein AtubIFM57258_002470 [Aspergillus tubingensis]